VSQGATTKLVAMLIIGLIIGAGIGYLVKPTPSPGPDWVSKAEFDALQADFNAAQADLDEAEDNIASLQADLTTALAEIANLRKPKKIGLILATGGLGDKSFNDISFDGVQRAHDELGIVFDYVEPRAIAEYEGFQRAYASSGEYALIVCVGFDQKDALNIVAAEYPQQNFVLIDEIVDKPNVANLLFKANEGCFLIGALAGALTVTDKVGFVGGMDIPLIRDFFLGYEAGVEWANPDATVLTPVFVGGWADPTKGKEMALGLADLGADAIFVAAGKSGLGALEAINERNITGFGVDACQDYLYPAFNIVASQTKRTDNAIYEKILKAILGKFQGGVYTGGVKEKWTGCCRLGEELEYWEHKFNFTHVPLPTALMNKLYEARDKIITGEITVPSAFG